MDITFKRSPYILTTLSITATEGDGGTVRPLGEVTVPYGDDQTFTITPDIGFQVANVAVDGASVGAVTSYTFTNITENHTIEATFTAKTYTITATFESGGTILPSGGVIVSHGAEKLFTMIPNTGYHVSDVLVDDASVGAVTSYTFTNVTEDHTIHATFTLNTYIVAGRVTETGIGLENVLMSGLPGNSWTDANGIYSAQVDYGWSGTVTPHKAGYAFVPSSKNYPNVTGDQLNQDYMAIGIATIDLGFGNERRGGEVTVPIILTPVPGENISAVFVDIGYDPTVLENPSAEIGAAARSAGKHIGTNLLLPGLFRVSVFSFSNNRAIGIGIIAYQKFIPISPGSVLRAS